MNLIAERGRIDYNKLQEILHWCAQREDNPTVTLYAKMLIKQTNFYDEAEKHLHDIIERFELIRDECERYYP